MWAIEDSPGPKAAYREGWYHFTSGYTTQILSFDIGGVCSSAPNDRA